MQTNAARKRALAKKTQNQEAHLYKPKKGFGNPKKIEK